MTVRPILMSAPMVRAILEGRKTQTRRFVKPQPGQSVHHGYARPDGDFTWCLETGHGVSDRIACPYGRAGDSLWVRETWRVSSKWDALAPRDLPFDRGMTVMYAAGGSRAHNDAGVYVNDNDYPPPSLPDWAGKTRVSIHMPRAASRITLKITDVRAERLKSISRQDSISEGATSRPDCSGFKQKEPGWSMDWLRIGQPSKFSHDGRTIAERDISMATPCGAFFNLWESINGPDSWALNPWVWALSFEVAKP